MIDIHCHLEQKAYNDDRYSIIEKCQNQLKAIITSCAHPQNFDLTLEIVEKFKNFVFATAGMHPIYIKEFSNVEINSFIEKLKINRKKFVGVGETGLDYFWVKNENQRENQKKLFTQLISLAKQLELPLIIHSRDAYEDTIEILEQEQARNVVMHMFGANKLTKRVIKNNWHISMNSIVLKSKKHKKVVRDCPINKLLIETDSPWLAPDSFLNKRNDPTSTSYIVKKVAEIKKTNFEEIDKITTENAINFFQLKI